MLVAISQIQAVCIRNLPCMVNNCLLAFAQKTKWHCNSLLPAFFRALMRCGRFFWVVARNATFRVFLFALQHWFLNLLQGIGVLRWANATCIVLVMATESNTLAGVIFLVARIQSIAWTSLTTTINCQQKNSGEGPSGNKGELPHSRRSSPKGLLGGGVLFFSDPSRVSRRKHSLSAGAGFVPGRWGFVAWGFVPDWVFRISPPSSLSFIIWLANHTLSAHCACPRPSNKNLPSPRRHHENPKATPPKKLDTNVTTENCHASPINWDATSSVGHQVGAAFCLQSLFCLRLTMRKKKKATRRRGVEGT